MSNRIKNVAEKAFSELCRSDGAPEMNVHRIIKRIECAGDPEYAFFSMLRACLTPERKELRSRLIAVTISAGSAEWSFHTLHAFTLLRVPDPDAKGMTSTNPRLEINDERALVNVIARSNQPQWMYRALKDVYLDADQQEAMLRGLKRCGSGHWIRETVCDVRLTDVHKKLLY